MLHITAKLPTKNLPIRRVLAKLFQSFVYHSLDNKEHEGYKHTNGKVFKSMNFKIAYIENEIIIKYSALDKENEKIIAQTILKEGLKLGEIHISNIELSLKQREITEKNEIKIGGFISAAIKDGTSKKKIYLEPKSHKFQEIIHNNTIQKYEALFNKAYTEPLKIELIKQQPHPKTFFYDKGAIKTWHGIYKIEASQEMIRMILDTGIGANTMKGLGFVEVLK